MLENLVKHIWKSHHDPIPCATYDIRDYGSLTKFPKYIDTVEKTVLYALTLYYPRMFCASSLIAVTGYSSDEIRPALHTLFDKEMVSRKEVPKEVRPEKDHYFYRAIPEKIDEAILFMKGSLQAATYKKEGDTIWA